MAEAIDNKAFCEKMRHVSPQFCTFGPHSILFNKHVLRRFRATDASSKNNTRSTYATGNIKKNRRSNSFENVIGS